MNRFLQVLLAAAVVAPVTSLVSTPIAAPPTPAWFDTGSVAVTNDVAFDASGNVFSCGYYEGLGTVFGHAFPETDGFFLAKHDPTGSLQWIRGGSSFNFAFGKSLAVDPDGDVFVLAINGIGDVTQPGFLRKYSADGDSLWNVDIIAYAQLLELYKVRCDAAGNATLTGWFDYYLDFGDTLIAPPDPSENLVVSYDPDGNRRWFEFTNGAIAIAPDAGVAVAPDGSIYDAWGEENVLHKYDTNHALIWERSLPDSVSAGGVAFYSNVEATPDGGALLAGTFVGILSLDGHAVTSQSMSVASPDLFVARCDAGGQFQWVEAIYHDGTVPPAIHRIGIGGDGSFAVTGDMFASIKFTNAATFTAPNTSDLDSKLFVARYGAGGMYEWAAAMQDGPTSSGRGTALSAHGAVALAGVYTDSGTLSGVPLTTQTGENALVFVYGAGPTGARAAPPSRALRVESYPNPFNPATTLRYRVADPGHIRLTVHGVDGSLVRTLVDRDVSAGGDGVARWDGRNDRGTTVATGVYFAVLRSGSQVATTRLVLLK